MPRQSLAEKLKQRKVVQWSLAYIAAAWIVAQVIEIVAGPWGIPAGWIRTLHLALVGGLPIAIILSWFHGERGEQRIGSAEVAALAIVLLVMGIGFLVIDPVDDRSAPVEKGVMSVIVMPFEDLSPGGDQAWFAAGMTDELMNALVRVPNLEIVGRRTVTTFDPETQDLNEFARKIGVSHILDGSVRTADGRVRVSAQLVRIADNVNVWSDIFDERLSDVFSIQDRISDAVIDGLKPHLGKDLRPSSLARAEQDTDFDAYRLYLQGRYNFSLRTEESLERAVSSFEASLQVDSKRSRTHSALAAVYASMPYYSASRSPAELGLLALQHANLALQADGDNPEALSVIGVLNMTRDKNWDGAGKAFGRAFELAPGSAYIANLYGDYFYAIGDYESALRMEGTAARLDPLSAVNQLELGLVHSFRGEYEEAIRQAKLAIDLNAQLPNAWWQLFRAHFLSGDLEAARRLVANNAAELGDRFLAEARVLLAVQAGRIAEAHQVASAVASDPRGAEMSLTKLALLFALAGDDESAARHIERAFASGDAILISPMHFFLPEDWLGMSGVVAALDKPGLRELFELRRSFISRGVGRHRQERNIRGISR